MPTVHLAVRGVVQGVGFRWFVRQRARRWDMAGWVRNQADGSVELALSGSDEAIQALLQAIRVGPPGAVVEDVATLPADELGELPRPFTVIR